MKSALGCLQFILWGGGIVALINGQWVAMIVSWVAAALVGFAGDRMVRLAEGVSQSGQNAVGDAARAIALLKHGDYASAVRSTRAFVAALRYGGDQLLLPLALTLHSVALAATGDLADARRALGEASQGLRSMPRELTDEADDLRRLHESIQRELDRGAPDPSRVVAEFIAWSG